MTGSASFAHVTHKFSSKTAVNDVSLSLQPGITGLLGPNGAGKTTLLRIAATVLAPTSGSVTLLGRDASNYVERIDIRRRLGYLPQELGFPRGFTTFGFVDYMAILKEWDDRTARHAEVRRVLDAVDLTDESTRRIRRLSGGMRRRLGIAQALLGRPEFLVLDEPTTGLDPEQRARLRAVLSAIGERSTVLLSTHQTDDVAALCDRVVVMDQGAVVFDGAVTDLVASAMGRVWLADDVDHHAVAHWRTGAGRIRNVGDPPVGVELVEPTVEDAYLLMRARGAHVTT